MHPVWHWEVETMGKLLLWELPVLWHVNWAIENNGKWWAGLWSQKHWVPWRSTPRNASWQLSWFCLHHRQSRDRSKCQQLWATNRTNYQRTSPRNLERIPLSHIHNIFSTCTMEATQQPTTCALWLEQREWTGRRKTRPALLQTSRFSFSR